MKVGLPPTHGSAPREPSAQSNRARFQLEFAIDGSGLGLGRGKVCYHASDSLKWEKPGLGYSEFPVWSFQGDLTAYYADLRMVSLEPVWV